MGWQTNIGHYVICCKEVDTEVKNPEWVNAAIQHSETSQTIIQPVMPTSGEIPDFIYEITEPPERTLLDDNISTIAANIAGPVCHLSLIKHHLEGSRCKMQLKMMEKC